MLKQGQLILLLSLKKIKLKLRKLNPNYITSFKNKACGASCAPNPITHCTIQEFRVFFCNSKIAPFIELPVMRTVLFKVH